MTLIAPVLPLRIGGKLIFPVCKFVKFFEKIFPFSVRACALLREHGKASRLVFAYSDVPGMNDHLCNHTELERGFVTTTTEIELNLALSRGYRVTHLYTYVCFSCV